MKQIKNLFAQIKIIFYHFFILQRRFRQRLFLRQKIKRLIHNNSLLKNTKQRDKKYLNESLEFLQKIHRGYKNTNWHYAYSTLNGNKDVRYIPEELFFPFIEPALNYKLLKNAYTDKTATLHFFDSKYLPETVFNIINGKFFRPDNNWVENEKAVAEITEINETLILKPAIFSGGGKNITVGTAAEIIQELHNKTSFKKDNLVIQKFAHQHPVLEKFNSSSLNTLRIMTARVKNEIRVISVYFRMGKRGNKIDNIVAGGILCGVNPQGKLHKTGYDIRFNKYEKHPDAAIIFENFEIPGYQNATDFCKKHHKKFPHFTFISWDIGISPETQPIFIEMNLSSQEIGCHQIINGPLFGENTAYFIEEYKNSMIQNQIRLNL